MTAELRAPVAPREPEGVLKENREKRPRGSPTGVTPLLKEKRHAGRPKEVVKVQRRLPFISTADVWSDSEQSALVEFILLHKPGTSWPADKNTSFWDAAATFVHIRSRSDQVRTG